MAAHIKYECILSKALHYLIENNDRLVSINVAKFPSLILPMARQIMQNGKSSSGYTTSYRFLSKLCPNMISRYNAFPSLLVSSPLECHISQYSGYLFIHTAVAGALQMLETCLWAGWSNQCCLVPIANPNLGGRGEKSGVWTCLKRMEPARWL